MNLYDIPQFYTSFACNDTSDLVDAKQRLENCVADINLWMTANKLKLNNDKSKFLFLHSRFRHSLPPPNIRPSQQARNLGVIFEDTMSLSPHVNTIVKGAFYHVRNISKIRKYIITSTTEILIHRFVSSKLDFCNCLLHMELASSENHHKPHNINLRFNDYSISVAGSRTLRVSSVLN